MFFVVPWKLNRATPKETFPTANVALIALNVLIYLLGWHWTVGRGSPATSIVMYGFCHGGQLHLIFNMWALWVFGNPVNRRLGHAYYVLAYLGSLVAIGLFARLFLSVGLVGSSGALFAVIAIALLLMPASVLKVACLAMFPLTIVVGLLARPKEWFHWLVRWATFSVPTLWCLLLIPLMQLWSFFWDGWSWAPVAHLMGMLCGLAVVLMLPSRITMGRPSMAGI